MPQVVENEDGTKTFSVNSKELWALRSLVGRYVPGVKKVLDLADSSEARQVLSFVRSALS